MNRFRILSCIFILILAGCISRNNASDLEGTPSALPPLCGNGICQSGETHASCPVDCPLSSFSGQIEITTINSEGIGNIAVMVASPETARYSNGAGIVVVVPPVFTEVDGFMTDPDATSLGLIQVSFLWPGKSDKASGAKSEGMFDYGGRESAQVLRDVIRYASARKPDIDNRYVVTLTHVPPLTNEVGLYAFDDASIPVVNELSLADEQLQNLLYYIGRENPTTDSLTCKETGYFNTAGQKVVNPFYLFPSSYSFSGISLNYSNLRWDMDYTDERSANPGRPYLDLDGNGVISPGDFIFDGQIPEMNGKRYYSAALTQALMNNGVLSLANWPDTLATPQESAFAWTSLQNMQSYGNIKNDEFLKDLKVMLVFADVDHAQVAADKPHIHQAFQGFRFEARLWVRLNPDRAYIQEILQKSADLQVTITPAVPATPIAALEFPDNPANTQPTDWLQISSYAYPLQGGDVHLIPLAAVAEMADRAHDDFWDENLGQSLYGYPTATPQP